MSPLPPRPPIKRFPGEVWSNHWKQDELLRRNFRISWLVIGRRHVELTISTGTENIKIERNTRQECLDAAYACCVLAQE